MKSGLFVLLGFVVILAAPPVALAQVPDGPLDVDEAVRIALRQNYAYQQQEAIVAGASGNRLNAIAGMLPFLNGSYTYNKSDGTTTLIDFPVIQDILTETTVATANLDLADVRSSNVWGFGVSERLSLPIWYNYRSAHSQVSWSRFGQEAAAQQLGFDIRSQFYLVLRAQDLLTVQQEDLRLARDEERRINSMFELGSVARVDVLKARVRVSDAEVALIRQQNAVDIESSRLATMMGFTPDTKLQLAGELSVEIAPLDSVAAANAALSRPDLQQARAALSSASNLHKAAITSWVPSLFADFSYSKSAGDRGGDDLGRQVDPNTGNLVTFPSPSQSSTEFDGWNLRVGAEVNLDALLNVGDYKRAGADKRQAEYTLEGLELAALQELEEAILTLRASLSAIEAAESGVESAEEDLRLSQERYKQGLGTILELLEAQVNLTRARNTLVNALTGLKISEAALDKARGAPLPY
jgi:outer membrane protein TolC